MTMLAVLSLIGCDDAPSVITVFKDDRTAQVIGDATKRGETITTFVNINGVILPIIGRSPNDVDAIPMDVDMVAVNKNNNSTVYLIKDNTIKAATINAGWKIGLSAFIGAVIGAVFGFLGSLLIWRRWFY
jgi:hypothetical protein